MFYESNDFIDAKKADRAFKLGSSAFIMQVWAMGLINFITAILVVADVLSVDQLLLINVLTWFFALMIGMWISRRVNLRFIWFSPGRKPIWDFLGLAGYFSAGMYLVTALVENMAEGVDLMVALTNGMNILLSLIGGILFAGSLFLLKKLNF
jgi:hypothetical protein